MNNRHSIQINWYRRLLGWSIHVFTASGACVGLFALYMIDQHEWIQAFWLMSLAILIDAVDGMFARAIKVKEVVPEIDGALLDNIVDFVNYTIVPAFFIFVTDILPPGLRFFGVLAIIFSSAYQFTQVDAKTSDHFFKGFPSYWNIVVFYLFFWQMSTWNNLLVILILAILSFVPIKYVYPSRLDYLTRSPLLRMAMVFATLVWGMATAGLLWVYPETNHLLLFLSMGYLILYIGISLYRTWVPLQLVECLGD